MTDDEFDGLLGEARALLDADIARERREVVPDFVAVIEAAHAANPASVGESALREVAEFAPIVELIGDEHHDPEFAREFAAITADVREQVEAEVAARRLSEIPPLRTIITPPVSTRGPRVWVMGVALAAVVVGLALGIPRLLDFVGGKHAAKQIDNQAEFIREDQPELGKAEPLRMAAVPPPPHAAIVHAASTEASVEAKQVEAVQPTPRPRTRDDASLRDRVDELEQRARAHWQAGELAQAESIYRQIITIAGRTRYADLAYGDLFTLAHQRKDSAAELALWQEYLRVLPQGRFVEDARAGICRKGEDGQRSTCWREYLDDYPNGLHAARAQRELGEVP